MAEICKGPSNVSGQALGCISGLVYGSERECFKLYVPISMLK